MTEPAKVTDINSARAPDWNKVRILYEEGGSDPEAAKMLNLTMKRFHELIEEVPAFKQFVEMGRTLSMAWWYEQGRSGLRADKFNGPLFMANMKNRFGWADKVETNATSNDAPANLDQLKSEVAKMLKKLAKKNPELLTTTEPE